MESTSYVFVLQIWAMDGTLCHSECTQHLIGVMGLSWGSASCWTKTQQNEDLLWLQLNSCFHGRTGLHMSSVVIHMFKRAANYIATALASFCYLRISKHLDTCDELIVPEIQGQPLLGLPFLAGTMTCLLQSNLQLWIPDLWELHFSP